MKWMIMVMEMWSWGKDLDRMVCGYLSHSADGASDLAGNRGPGCRQRQSKGRTCYDCDEGLCDVYEQRVLHHDCTCLNVQLHY